MERKPKHQGRGHPAKDHMRTDEKRLAASSVPARCGHDEKRKSTAPKQWEEIRRYAHQKAIWLRPLHTVQNPWNAQKQMKGAMQFRVSKKTDW